MRLSAILPMLSCILVTAGHAAPLTREEVPTPLQPWISWVLKGQEQQLCSLLNGQDRRECAWPGALKLSLDDKGGRFEQAWRVEASGWAALPGDPERWPQDVKLDGAAAAVVRRENNMPAVRLKPGAHVLTGSFRWEGLPEHLAVPRETGVVALTLRGQPAPFPVRDEGGQLWLQARALPQAAREESHVDVTVHRRLVDEVPLQLITRVQLKVSGPNREMILGRALPDGFVPMALFSPIPARLDPDGRLRVQARAGYWDVMLTARQESRADAVEAPVPGGTWDADEVWVFDARPDLRLADLEGAPSLDPQQTQLPEDWKSLPAFLVKPGAKLQLRQRRRGDDPPPADRLSIERQLWLDFDGGGFSARDAIRGTLNRSWRLEAAEGTQLGRVEVGGQDQFLTVLATGAAAGLEIRTGEVAVVADSRFAGRQPPATGWRQDFESVSALLHLPPGWRLLYAGGVDQASSTWTSAWTLLDFFLVLVAAGAFGRLFGPRWGAAALVGLGLAWHESGAPRWLWLLALAAAALHRALEQHPAGGRPSLWGRRLAAGALVLFSLPFLFSQARVAMFPVLERPISIEPRAPGQAIGPEDMTPLEQRDGAALMMDDGPAAAAPEPESRADQDKSVDMLRLSELKKKAAGVAGALSYSAPRRAYKGRVNAQNYLARDPNARVTTGAGLPYWRWSTARLSWSGPVPQGHRMSLWLAGPRLNLVLAALRIMLVAALALLAAGLPVEEWLVRLRGGRTALLLLLLALLLLLLALLPAAPASAQQFPPRDLLDELRNRLLEKPECWPSCVDSPRLQVTATSAFLSLKLDARAAAPSALPVPTGGREWVPSRALLDGAPAGVRRGDDGQLWVPIPAGTHELTLEGPLPERDLIQIGLPLKPHRVEASVTGWTLRGLRDDGRSDDTLQLSRNRGSQAAEVAAARAQGVFPPLLQVQRVVRLGLSWTVETHVTRLTPPGASVFAEIPLLPGESVTTADIRVVKGKAQVSLPPQATGVYWSSVLKEADAVRLAAAPTTVWVESWRVEPGTMWHVTAAGVPAVHQDARVVSRAYAFRPWPGEAVDLRISKPAPTAGQTLTIDQSVLILSPGLRATDAKLSLSLRSSHGGQHAIVLPPDAELLSVTLDGALTPLRLEGRKLSLPVQPGSRSVEVSWRQPGGAGLLYRAPAVDLGAPSVNAHVQIQLPARRWTLLTGGGGPFGPVVLFWSMLAVSALVCLGLARARLTPLSWQDWFLLSLGLLQSSVAQAVLVGAWFLALGARGRMRPQERSRHELAQALLVALTLAAALALAGSIKHGLLGLPQLQIAGNGSSSSLLRWYFDRAGQALPRPWLFTLPLWLYRVGMLAWALWLAESLLRWVRWGWAQFTAGGLWKPD